MSEWRRRTILAALGASASGTALALGGNNEKDTLSGGTMALSEAFNVSGDLWIGPDSAKSNVDANSGRVYMASDTQVEYYGDNGSWTKLGVGSSSEPVPSVTTEQANNVRHIQSDVDDVTTAVNNAVSDFPIPSVSEDHSFKYGRYDSFDSTTGWSGENATLSTTSDNVEGSNAVQIDESGTNPGLQRTGLSEDWSGYDTAKVWVKADRAVTIKFYAVDGNGNNSVVRKKRLSAANSYEELTFNLNGWRVGTQGNFDYSNIAELHLYAETAESNFTWLIDDLRRYEVAHLYHDAIESLSIGSLTDGTDYFLDATRGVIRPIIGGSLSSGTTYTVDYSYYEQGIIHIDGGDYAVDDAISIDRPKTTLEGDGKATRLYRTSENSIIQIQADHCEVRTLQLDGLRERGTKEIHNMQITAEGETPGTEAATEIYGCRVENVWSHDGMGDGLEIMGHDHVIVDNRFENNFEDALHLRGGSGIVIADNVLSHDQTGPGVKLWDDQSVVPHEDVLIEGNMMEGNLGKAVEIGAGQAEAIDVRVVDNIFKASAGSVIYVKNAMHATVSENTFVEGGKGVEIRPDASHIRVTNNTFRELNQQAVFSTGASDIHVRDNDIFEVGGAGVRIQSIPSDVFVIGNHIENPNRGERGDPGIQIADSGGNLTRVQVNENRVICKTGYARDGIRFVGTTVSSTQCRWNHIEGVGFDRVQNPPSDFRGLTGDEITENSGQTTASDGDTIAHGIIQAPPIEQCEVLTASSNRAYVTGTDASSLTIALEDPSGSALTTDETIYWKVEV